MEKRLKNNKKSIDIIQVQVVNRILLLNLINENKKNIFLKKIINHNNSNNNIKNPGIKIKNLHHHKEKEIEEVEIKDINKREEEEVEEEPSINQVATVAIKVETVEDK